MATDESDEEFGELRERAREGLRLFDGYLQQPEEQRAAGADGLLESAMRAHLELSRLLDQANAAYGSGREQDQPTDPRISALQRTLDIARRANIRSPDEVAEQAGQGGRTDVWVADASARYSAFVVAALTVQDALLDDAISADEYSTLLAEAARELAAVAAGPSE